MNNLPRLCEQTLSRLPATIGRPGYDRGQIKLGVLHFGPGAFHRAHQAAFFDELLAKDPRWGVSAVSLNSPGVRDALLPQDSLYTLAELDETTRFRVLGAIGEVLLAPAAPEAVFDRLTHPDLRLVTITATEKGYHLGGSGELDLDHPDIRHDLANPTAPRSLIGWLSEGLRRRRVAGQAPLTVISCDNLSENGHRLAAAVARFAGETDPDLAAWVAGETRFPRTMVDSITPATDEGLRTRVRQALGLDDAWPVQRERFAQWVIEDLGIPDSPDWARVGVTLSSDVAGYEQAKLRLLNAAHSTLAYLGLLQGATTVADAMRSPDLAAFVRRLMLEDIAATLRPPAGLILADYVEAVLGRFGNPAIAHQLAQIAADGSQKLPIRLLATIRDALALGRPVDRLAVPLAAWMRFVVKQARNRQPIVDPLSETLIEIGGACTDLAQSDVEAFMRLDSLFPRDLARLETFQRALRVAYSDLVDRFGP